MNMLYLDVPLRDIKFLNGNSIVDVVPSKSIWFFYKTSITPFEASFDIKRVGNTWNLRIFRKNAWYGPENLRGCPEDLSIEDIFETELECLEGIAKYLEKQSGDILKQANLIRENIANGKKTN